MVPRRSIWFLKPLVQLLLKVITNYRTFNMKYLLIVPFNWSYLISIRLSIIHDTIWLYHKCFVFDFLFVWENQLCSYTCTRENRGKVVSITFYKCCYTPLNRWLQRPAVSIKGIVSQNVQLEKINCLRVCVNKPIKLRGAIFTRTKRDWIWNTT
jgi:hypothetical protein